MPHLFLTGALRRGAGSSVVTAAAATRTAFTVMATTIASTNAFWHGMGPTAV
jgi:hypothetical protein